jgi:hypothetical protein
MITSLGCVKTDAQIVEISDYCDRHISRNIEEETLIEAELVWAENEERKRVINFFIDYYAQNEREFENCKL